MKESVKRIMLIPAVIVLGASIPALGRASVTDLSREPVRVEVFYGDLDLARAAGIEQLYRRLKSAAASACGSTSLHIAGSVRQAMNNRACYRDVLARAVKQADIEALSERHSV